MANGLIELTRVDAGQRGTTVMVNLDNVAWIEADERGMSRIVFAIGLPHEHTNGAPLTLVVREDPGEIALLAGVVRKTDRDAIAQAWIDQRGRRSISAEDE